MAPRKYMQRIRKTSGFTIVELAVAVPVIVIVMAVVLGFLITLLTDFSSQRTRQTMNVSGQVALAQIEADTKLASEFLTGIDTATYVDNYGPDNAGGSWSYEGKLPLASPYNRTLILQTYATTKNPADSTRTPVYLNSTGCTGDQLYLNDVLRNVVIYFVRNETLYKRTLVDKDAASKSCSSTQPFQVVSCPTDVSPRAANCVSDDVELIKNVTNFNVQYYLTPGSSTAQSVYNANPANPLSPANPDALVDSLSADITITQKTSSNVTDTSTLRITRIN